MKLRRLALVLAMLAILAAGCGDDGSDEGQEVLGSSSTTTMPTTTDTSLAGPDEDDGEGAGVGDVSDTVESEGDEDELCRFLSVGEVAAVYPGAEAVATDGSTCYYLDGTDDLVGVDVSPLADEAAAGARFAEEVERNGPDFGGQGCATADIGDEAALCPLDSFIELVLRVGPSVFIVSDFGDATGNEALLELAAIVASRA